MSNKSCGDEGAAYAILSTLPIGQPIALVLENALVEGTWSGFIAGNATLISSANNKAVYVTLDKIQSVTVR
ncbi:hypothetical protein M3194_03285 [Paenibacillus glycanilyticus]|uniref:hypothetical protein n=1 Tax=Paenibacillus glycanilyticus TaxID=126569 RepID=UPI002041C9D1|nr:hypothetical protein [Paenibacillus glycanilyticus]MCM3626393.1 hypothetical protein [Paenibacillus glycanilyticus]